MVHKVIHRSEIVPYSSKKMYALVSDISAYQHFLPYCVSSSIISQSKKSVHGQMTFSYMGLSYTLETENTMYPYSRIDLQLLKGDVQALDGQWQFVDDKPGMSRVSLDLEIDMHDAIFYRLYNRILDKLADSMVDHFIDRATQVYGLGED